MVIKQKKNRKKENILLQFFYSAAVVTHFFFFVLFSTLPYKKKMFFLFWLSNTSELQLLQLDYAAARAMFGSKLPGFLTISFSSEFHYSVNVITSSQCKSACVCSRWNEMNAQLRQRKNECLKMCRVTWTECLNWASSCFHQLERVAESLLEYSNA